MKTRYPVPQRAETHGRSEEYFGRWFRERKVPRDSVVLATKVFNIQVFFISLCISSYRLKYCMKDIQLC